MTKRTSDATAVATPYEPNSHEQRVLAEYRQNKEQAAPKLKVEVKGDTTHLSFKHPDQAVGLLMLMQAIGTKDMAFYDGLIAQLANAGTQSRQVDERQLNFMLSVIQGIEPRDQMEAMLAAQMAAVHSAMMKFARRLSHADTIQQQDSASNAFNKLARTFASQLETLKKYRSTGEQKVTVQHVQVNEGGQAIVGDVIQGGGDGSKKREPTS
jgi:hypothetical protein